MRGSDDLGSTILCLVRSSGVDLSRLSACIAKKLPNTGSREGEGATTEALMGTWLTHTGFGGKKLSRQQQGERLLSLLAIVRELSFEELR